VINIDKLEALERAATPAPWVYDDGIEQDEHTQHRERPETVGPFGADAARADDCIFLVELRNAAPALIAELRRLRSENETLQMQLAACGVLASCNTSDSLERHRQMHPDFLGASVHAVIEAAQREIKLLAEVRRLRAIEAAARSYMACAHAGPWEQFTSSLASLEAALAAKEEK
jgi:hypothetical protein